MKKRFLIAAGATSILTAGAIPVASALSSGPPTPVGGQVACVPVPALGLACGALGSVPGSQSVPDVGNALQKVVEGPRG